jgi:oxygen-independent coproporphyrinogen-3 oxidase
MCAGNEEKSQYIDALIKEIYLSRDKMAGKYVNTVFIGGGTPSILEYSHIERIMTALRKNCNIYHDAEITIECNPGTVTEEKLVSYKKAGINRISFGLQSVNDEELKSIGRIHNYAEFVDSYKMARSVGFDNINIDIMSALPNQSLKSYEKTLKEVVNLEPEHISAYSLIIEDETPLKDRVEAAREHKIDILPDEDTEREMYYMTGKILKDAGYVQYEISNYSKPGYECRHNIGYWKRVNYLGFGLGAASLYNNTRYNNTYDIGQYISILSDNQNLYEVNALIMEEEQNMEEDVLSVLEGKIQNLTLNDRMEEFMFLGLRMNEGISAENFRECFGRDINRVYGKVIEKLKNNNLITQEGDRIILTPRGVDISNYVLSEFLL